MLLPNTLQKHSIGLYGKIGHINDNHKTEELAMETIGSIVCVVTKNIIFVMVKSVNHPRHKISFERWQMYFNSIKSCAIVHLVFGRVSNFHSIHSSYFVSVCCTLAVYLSTSLCNHHMRFGI